MTNHTSTVRIVIGGICALAVAMGVGRFAYTPILPYMQGAAHLSDAMAGYLASVNYAGYLLGALFAGLVRWRKGKTPYLRAFLAVNIATTLAMGLTDEYFLWVCLRLVSGVTSGLVFVLVSSLVLDALASAKRPAWSGWFYSGVGLGILISGLVVPVFVGEYGWHGAWTGMGLLAMVIAAPTLLWLTESSPDRQTAADAARVTPAAKKGMLPWLIGSYACEGLGYIVSGTFLVALVQKLPSLAGIAALSWVFVGAAAIPSCLLWALIAGKLGNARALQAAFAIQVVGVILPAMFNNAYGALIGALLFGATFMGITTLAVSEGRTIAPEQSSRIIGYLTCVYGIGQMTGPSVAGILIARSGTYRSSLIFAAAVLVCGMLFLAAGMIRAARSTKVSGSIVAE